MIRWRIETRAALEHAFGRLRDAWSALLLAAVAAAAAWWITHQVLGHSQPFFAPIAAAISLSTSRIQRSRRIAQMVVGVLLGIAIGELGASALGTSTLAVGVIVFVTFCVAVLAGAGFVGEGMMFANQAAASAILVVTVHRVGAGSERAIDALVGGGVALVLGTGLFPAQPLAMLGDAERSVLATLAGVLRRAALHAREQQPDEEWLLQAGGMWPQPLLERAHQTADALRAYADCHSGSMAPAILGSIATDIDHLTATPEEVSVASARRP